MTTELSVTVQKEPDGYLGTAISPMWTKVYKTSKKDVDELDFMRTFFGIVLEMYKTEPEPPLSPGT